MNAYATFQALGSSRDPEIETKIRGYLANQLGISAENEQSDMINSLILLAGKCDEEEFNAAISDGEVPPVKLSNAELNMVSGGLQVLNDCEDDPPPDPLERKW